MAQRRNGRIALLTGAALFVGVSARAASVEDDAQRLDDLLYFVSELDRGWDPLLVEVGRTLESLGERPRDDVRPVLAVRDEVTWLRAEHLFTRGGPSVEERCLTLYRVLATDALDPARRESATRRLADILIRRGERLEAAGDEDGALAAYLEAVDHAPEYEAGYEKVGALGVRQAARKADAQDFDGALATLAEVLVRIERGLPPTHPSVVEARARRESILAGSGVLTVRFLGDAARLDRVRGAKTDFRVGSLALAPQDGGAVPPPVPAAATRRVRIGRFRVVATGAGGPERWTEDVVVRPDGAAVAVPVLIPQGMVVVPASGGAPSFLCDRTEVSNAAYQEFAATAGGRSAGGDPRNAANGISFGDARRYAAWAGKDLPTLAQWTHAAFGTPNARAPRYPWGDAEGTPGTHFFAGLAAPGPVDGCPAGASPCGALNMAGNVFEWLSDGWFIGGGFVATKFSSTVGYARPVNGQPSWEADFLRDKVPTIEIYDAMTSPEQKNKYDVYRVTPDKAEAFLRQVGLRCVVPLE